MNRFFALDISRAFAILGVVSVHSTEMTVGTLAGDGAVFTAELLSLGRYGVELFFLISGFLIGNLYERNWQGAGHYLVGRLLRIVPLWSVFCIFWYLVLSQKASSNLDKFDLIAALSFTDWLGASTSGSLVPGGWSITVEVACYFIFLLIRNRSANLILLCGAIVCLLAILFKLFASSSDILAALWGPVEMLSLHSGLPYFILGILASRIQKERKKGAEWSKAIQELKIDPRIAFAFFASFALTPVIHGNNVVGVGFIAGSIILSLYFAAEDGIVRRILTAIGRKSYFIYFFHFVVLYALPNGFFQSQSFFIEGVDFVLVSSSALLISFALSFLSWGIFEKPLLELRNSAKRPKSIDRDTNPSG
jgi:peptidoglycan/LPS O-acetylase OafA/YrhL